MIYQNVLEAMGHTPMIQLNKMADPEGARVLVKFEGLNVGGCLLYTSDAADDTPPRSTHGVSSAASDVYKRLLLSWSPPAEIRGLALHW